MLVTWIGLFSTLLAGRLAARSIARRTTQPERCLLLGDPDACASGRVSKIEGSATASTREIVAEITSARIGEDEVPLGMLAELAVEHDVQRVIIAPRSTDHGDVLNLVRAVKSLGLNVSVLPRLLEIVGSSVVVDDIEGLRVLGVRAVRPHPLVELRQARLRHRRLRHRAARARARCWPLIAVAVQARVARTGALPPASASARTGDAFNMLKFRTMVDGAEELKAALVDLNEADGLFKIADDPRVTRVGRFLRRTSLDELPQLHQRAARRDEPGRTAAAGPRGRLAHRGLGPPPAPPDARA